MKVVFETDGQIKNIDIPFSVEEIRFSDFCDFRQAEKVFFDAVKTGDETAFLLAAVDMIKKLCRGDVDEIAFNEGREMYNDLVEREYRIQPGDELTIIRIYAHLTVLINEYKPAEIPVEFSMKWLGSNYTINRKEAARVLFKMPISTGEFVEIMEIRRKAEAAMESGTLDVGNIEFTLGLSEFAILVRKKGEKLPSDKNKLTQFIRNRSEIFKNLPLSDVLSARFFFINLLIEYAVTPITSFSGMAPRVLEIQCQAKKKAVLKRLRKMLGV